VSVPFELRLAVRYLRVHRGRTFLSVITSISIAGVAVGAAALVIALSLMTGFEADMKQRILRGSADLQILDRSEASFDDANAVLAQARAIPGVSAAAPVLYSPAMIMNDVAGAPSYAEIEGVDPAVQGHVVNFGPHRGPSRWRRLAVLLPPEGRASCSAPISRPGSESSRPISSASSFRACG
jgi:ABC-type lipoprotein release transport system permease subunit